MRFYKYEIELATDKMESIDVTFLSRLNLSLSDDKKQLLDGFGETHFQVHDTFIQFLEKSNIEI
jgi:hypothetical protein